MTSVSPVNTAKKGMSYAGPAGTAKSFTMVVGVCLAGTLTGLTVVLTIHQKDNACDDHNCQKGTCQEDTSNDRGYTCICMKDYIGKYCEVHACDNNICQNGATCQADQSSKRGYTCNCNSAYIGESCEVNACANHRCDNGGSCEADLSAIRNYTCNCINGYIGDLCTVLPTDCKDLHDNGYNISGVYGIHPFKNNFRPIRVYCDMQTMGGGWTAIQKRIDGSLRFNKRWVDFKNGFGAPEKNTWIGNDVIHQLTKGHTSSLYISITLVNGTTLYELYDRFFVDHELNKYQLRLAGSATGTLGDAMLNTGTPTADLSLMYFSTPDQDNDQFKDGNCAAVEDCGWWFNDCYVALLNGLWGRLDWIHPWHPTVESGRYVKRTAMMVRRA